LGEHYHVWPGDLYDKPDHVVTDVYMRTKQMDLARSEKMPLEEEK
jgi:hypothetical protein